MDFLPSPHQERSLFGYDPNGATSLPAGHVFGPDQFETALGPNKVDLGFPVPEHMNICRDGH
jgi:hypothetical protein